jgi:hypothetical protein
MRRLVKQPNAHKQGWTWEHSAGILSGGDITNPSGDTIRISAGTALVRTENDDQSQIILMKWSQTDIDFSAKTNNAIHYIYVDWNSGTPLVTTNTDEDNINNTTQIELGAVVRETPTGGSTTYHINSHKEIAYDIPQKVQDMLEETLHVYRGEKEGGLILGESGDANRYVTVSAGSLWQGLTEFTISAFDTSGADTFRRYYRDGSSGWKVETAQSAWPNTNYDDNSGTLAAMGVNRYSVLWFYLETDGGVAMLYGQDESNVLADAEAYTPPTAVPPSLQEHATLIGRIIFQNGSTPAEAVESVYTTIFLPSGVTDHGSFAGLDDDDHNKYPLVTNFEADRATIATNWTDLTDAGATTLHKHDGVHLDGFADDDHTQYLIGRSTMCRVYHDANQNVNNATVTTLSFNQERFDPDAIHDTSTNNSRITPGVVGTYLVGANVQYATDAGGTGSRDILMDLNAGGTYIGHARQKAGTNSDSVNCNVLWRTTASADYFEIDAFQTSGGALNVNTTANRSPEFWCMRVQ